VRRFVITAGISVIPNGVKEWWSIGVFNTPTLHYSITPGRQISTGVRMSEATILEDRHEISPPFTVRRSASHDSVRFTPLPFRSPRYPAR
jgi:hypothetical protein